MSILTSSIQQVLTASASSLIHDRGEWFQTDKVKGDMMTIGKLLAAAGISKGSRVLIGYPNSYQFAAVYLGILQYGAVAVPFNPGMPSPELQEFILRSQAVAGFLLEEQLAAVRMAADERTGNAIIRVFTQTPDQSGMHFNSYIYGAGRRRLPDAGEQGLSSTRPQIESKVLNGADPGDEDPAVLLFTSGTTGKPKAVELKHRHLITAARHVIQAQQLTSMDVSYCFLPLFHINAQVVALLAAFLSGGKIVMAPKFSASRFWQTVEALKVTWVSAVPAVIGILLHTPAPATIPGQLRFVRSASSPLPVLHARRFERRFGIPVIESYGMSEAAGQICINPLPPEERRLGSVGRPSGVELQIADEAGCPLPEGQIGQVALRGESIIEAYGDDSPQDDFAAGWFYTGDMGYIDQDGFVFLTGRKKEMINRAGEKISPYEVENVIREVPRVKEAAVAGLPDPVYGERVAAYIVPEGKVDESALKREIEDYCNARISGYKCPSCVFIVSELPTGETGKISRTKLKQIPAAYATI